MKLCHCIKGDHWFQTEVEEGISKLWRTPLKNGGWRECSWGRSDLEPQGDQGGEPGSWQQHHGSLCWGMEQQGEAHVNCWLDGSRYNEFHTNILAHWSDQMLDPFLMYFLGTLIIQTVQFPCKFIFYQMFISCVNVIQSNWILVFMIKENWETDVTSARLKLRKQCDFYKCCKLNLNIPMA